MGDLNTAMNVMSYVPGYTTAVLWNEGEYGWASVAFIGEFHFGLKYLVLRERCIIAKT